MGAESLLDDLRAGGFRVELAPDGLTVSPRAALTDGCRSAIRANRDALLVILRREAKLVESLVASINRCCDLRGDDDANRAALIAECCELAPDGQADMREHFEQEAARWTPRSFTADNGQDRPSTTEPA